MDNKLNKLGEFHNKDIEQDYIITDIRKGLRVSRYITVIFSFTNLLYVILDYLFLEYSSLSVIIYYSLLPRIVILLAAVAVFLLAGKLKNVKYSVSIIVSFAVFMYIVHIFMAIHFAPVNMLYEVFDVVLMTTCLFILPNRWIVNLCVSFVLVVLFFMTVPLTIPTIDIGSRIMTTVYLFWHSVVISILMYKINIHKRLHYSKEAQLEKMINIDHLTKTHNRISCDLILEGLCKVGRDFSVVIFDIDDFKKVNDTYGHLVGDNVIIDIVNAVRKAVRKDDIVVRWGGEEFLVIMPNTRLAEATESAQRLKECISLIKHAKINHHITCSFGVTGFLPGDTIKLIINRADQLLYLAKEYGKNRVVAG
jgi:diguanylate cyclase (GGDEF)-like protein